MRMYGAGSEQQKLLTTATKRNQNGLHFGKHAPRGGRQENIEREQA
jgi:hypothetical protein